MLRLHPDHLPLWRTPTTLQFGVVPVAIVIDPTRWQQRLLRALEEGVPEAAIDMVAVSLGAPVGGAASFLRRVSAALDRRATERLPFVVVEAPDAFPSAAVDGVRAALHDAGFSVVDHAPDLDDRTSGDTVSVLLAHHLVEPRTAARLMADDRRHLPVVFSGTGVEVGPLVRPGETPCLACLAAHRRDADAAWPLLAAQLVGRRAPFLAHTLAVEAGAAVAAMLIDDLRDPQVTDVSSVTLHVGSLQRTRLAHHPHEDCRCRSLERIETPVARAIPAPTRATAYARPA